MKRTSDTTVDNLIKSLENDSEIKNSNNNILKSLDEIKPLEENESLEETEETSIKPSGNISLFKRLKLIELVVPMSRVYLGGEESIRYKKINNSRYLSRVFNDLSKFKYCNEIAIDGPSGVGKTTLMQCMSRKYAKINIGNHDVTNGPKYNISVIRSLSYIHVINSTECMNVVWDRCPFSNLIFYIVHFLVGYFENDEMPIEFSQVCPLISYFVKTTGIDNTVRWEMYEKNIPTLFLVNSDIKQLIKNLLNRGENKDFFLCGKHNYQYGQLFAYTYFAKMTNSPLIDISMVDNIDKCFADIIEHVDVDNNAETFVHYKENCNKLIEIDDYDNKDLVYKCSKK